MDKYNTDSEVWKPVIGYEKFYLVSSEGNIKSLDREVQTTRGVRRFKGKTKNPSLTSYGYLEISLSKDKIRRTLLMHRIVALTFLGDKGKGFVVNHIDGNKTNNTVENLEWVTYSKNNSHAYDKGFNPRKYKVPTEKRIEIKKMYKESNVNQKELAEMFNVSQITISRIVNT